MAKKTSKTVEKLRADVQALTEAVWALKEDVRVERAAESAANGSRSRLSPKLGKLEQQADRETTLGAVSSYGMFRLPGPNGDTRKVRWQVENTSVETLIPEDADAATQRLAAIGHKQRLAILLHLIQQPSSVSELVGTLDLGTSGAAYHHLNVLQGAGLVAQQERGIFEVAP
ncbi:MAG TPA: helix-turn-helix domain-containing protein, partial [Thermomicrobiales bacterium]|nr:helix-turn-helix domain-containing protein [Thermomicrobiales bacterium]